MIQRHLAWPAQSSYSSRWPRATSQRAARCAWIQLSRCITNKQSLHFQSDEILRASSSDALRMTAFLHDLQLCTAKRVRIETSYAAQSERSGASHGRDKPG